MENNQNRSPGKVLVSAILLAKPGIIVSVAFTGLAGMIVASKGIPPVLTIILGIIALLLSAAGSAILNNILDKKIDKEMSRLNKRVEAMETVGDMNALIISLLIILISLIISILYFNYLNTALILCAIISYTLLYTLFLKRSSPFGTILGGIPGALPVLIGYTAINNYIGFDSFVLFIFMMLWQPPHFWALAQKYKKDYENAKIPVLPVVFGKEYTNILILIYSLSLLPLTLILWFIGLNTVYFAIFATIAGIYFNYVVIKSVYRDSGYGKAFAISILYMLSVMLFVIIDIIINSLSPVQRVISGL
ncbi:MAG: protoheme IX farnesyltransferase [Candidatus Dadabacteria bacterium]|nr:protoheme IX farnesyltransferase [Candidatus Dadabacteria bacterium]NIQ14156.1 protoheme IX farnesyltransferase [Candidatus Dadabacteria bacterium]